MPVAAAAAACVVCSVALAQTTQTGEAVAGIEPHRLLRVFDFDDPGNPDPVPPGWERTTLDPDGSARAGFPKFNRAELDSKVAFSGSMSVRLPTAGGSAALRLRAGEVAIYEDADYAVSARIRTEGLEHARAFITSRLLDQHLRVIPNSEVRSPPTIAPGAWVLQTVQVPGGRSGAAWLQIDLELLQPRQFTRPAPDEPAAQALERHRLYREDVRGSAWFDDVAIMQIPRAELTTQARSNLVPASEQPELRVSVRDLGGEDLLGRLRVRDLNGRVIDDQPMAISPDGRSVAMKVRLDGFGWYRAELEVSAAKNPDEVVTRAETSFVWLTPSMQADPARSAMSGAMSPDGGAGDSPALSQAAALIGADRSRFGLSAEHTPEHRFGDLPELVQRLGTRFISLPVWQGDSTLEQAQASLERRRPAIDALLRLGQEVTFTIGGVPGELSRATRVAADDPLSLAGTSAGDWLGYLTPTLDIFGQRINRYQLGNVGGDQAYWRANPAADAGAIEAALATLVPGPMIALPWPADRALPSLDRPAMASARGDRRAGIAPAASIQPGPLIDSLVVHYPKSFPASQIRPVLDSLLSGQPPRELCVALDLPDPAEFGDAAVVTELMRRTVEFWALLGDGTISGPLGAVPAARVSLDQPWTWSAGGAWTRDGALWPSPALAAWAVLMDRLSGRRVVGELVGTPGVKCYILAARNSVLGTLERGALVAWNESAEPSRAAVDAAALGAEVVVVDAFGNRRSVMIPGSGVESTPGEWANGGGAKGRGAGGGGGGGSAPSPLVSVPVTEMPVFIEGIDPYLALFAASVRLDPSFMPAVVREHEHRIFLTNPWPVRITGKLQLKEDADRSVGRRSITDEWRVSPSGILDFDVAPGQTASVPVTLSYGPGQLAGIKDFVIIARAVADRPYPPIRLHASVEVGLEDIEMNPELQPTVGGDVVVVVAVTNKGTRARTLRLETTARNLPGQQLQVSDLPPGQTVLRRFVFKDAAVLLSGRRVVVSLSDLEEAQRLNKAVLVP